MLMKRATAYSSFCSQVVLVYLHPFCRNSLMKCAPQLKSTKNSKTPYFKGSRLFKAIDVDTHKKLVSSSCYSELPLTRSDYSEDYGGEGL